ncbi:voltage-gated potassium channel [Coprinopsis marcescibilis]|uniref:Voltage-gated potassium channel n=1 Tax=Coprinopsis marcescibilis TaxID=230819 RepID=A0A5C3KKF4_COPMA|nr:voltage-gated potassium channel [Coprinopsis marcescibilis]
MAEDEVPEHVTQRSSSDRNRGQETSEKQPSLPTTTSPRNPDDYRVLPIFSGVVIPFCVLLAVPSVTGDWYIKTDGKGNITETQPNPTWLTVMTSVGLACAVIANACLVVRFAERRPKLMTILSVGFLSIHDLLSIAVVILFASKHRPGEEFTFGQPFWTSLCGTFAAFITNITLVVDYIMTPNFEKNGSGLTRKQRSLVIIVIILLFYIAIGALVQCFLLDLTFINALYFTVVSIETIGFGDIRPDTAGSRIFTCFYIAFGILTLAVAVTQTRDALLEGVVVSLQNRIRLIRKKERDQRVLTRWQDAVKWHLRASQKPVWVSADLQQPEHHASSRMDSVRHWFRQRPAYILSRKLNVEALTTDQLEAAALEAGVSLKDLLPDASTQIAGGVDPALAPITPLTHVRVGNAARLLGSVAFAFSYGARGNALVARMDEEDEEEEAGAARDAVRIAENEDELLVSLMAHEEKLAFYIRLVVALTIFVIFWLVGSAVFMATEGWSFGISAYFCFITFTTVGYGDLTPHSPAGRSIFVVWALLGVATMTTLISILSEMYSRRYKEAIQSEIYDSPSSKTLEMTELQAFSEELNRLEDVRSGPYMQAQPRLDETETGEDITEVVVAHQSSISRQHGGLFVQIKRLKAHTDMLKKRQTGVNSDEKQKDGLRDLELASLQRALYDLEVTLHGLDRL